MFELGAHGEGVGWRPQECRACGPVLPLLFGFVGECVLKVALFLRIAQRQPTGERVRDAAVQDSGVDLPIDLRGEIGGEICGEILRRLAGGDDNRARGGVLAEQRCLRTLENFDGADVEKRGAELALAAGIDAVDEQADRLIEAEIEAGSEPSDAD